MLMFSMFCGLSIFSLIIILTVVIIAIAVYSCLAVSEGMSDECIREVFRKEN